MARGVYVRTEAHRRAISIGHIGIHVSEEARRKLSIKMKDNRNGFKSGGVPWNKGKHRPEVSGPRHWNWKEDRTALIKPMAALQRRAPIARRWIRRVKARDQWACRMASKTCKGPLEAHHIQRWRDHPDLRLEISNGITLCRFHHPKTRGDEDRLSPFFMWIVAEVLQLSQ